MNAIKLECRIREAIEGAIEEFEMDYGNVTNIEMEAHLSIDESGEQDLMVDLYETD